MRSLIWAFVARKCDKGRFRDAHEYNRIWEHRDVASDLSPFYT